MSNLVTILNTYGQIGVELLKQSVQEVKATGETERSIRYGVVVKDGVSRLTLFARGFFSTLETGRGPRQSASYEGFDKNLLEWMEARGIGSELNDKKRKQLARFFSWRINRDGDKTFQDGGRTLYSDKLAVFTRELAEELKKDFVIYVKGELKKAWQ